MKERGSAPARAKLNATRLNLFRADRRLDSITNSNSWRFTAPLRRLEERRGKAGAAAALAIRAGKAGAWLLTGQLPRRVRAWRMSHARAALERAETEKRPPQHVDTAVASIDLSPDTTNILIIDHSVPMADYAAGDRATLGVIEVLVADGWSVSFWPCDRAMRGDYTCILEAMGVTVFDSRYDGDLNTFLRQRGPRLDHVMIMRPQIAAAVLPIVLENTYAILSYYGHDLHFERLRREAVEKDDPGLADQAERMHALERAIWRVVDVVLYLSADEVAVVRKSEPTVEARAVTPFVFDSFVRRSQPTPSELLLFVGRLTYPPNLDAALWLAEAIFPRVLAARPNAQLAIVGSNPPEALRALAGSAIEITGYVNDQALVRYYDKSRVAMVPLRFGAGVKGKVAEAMSTGVPVVMTRIGAQGLSGLPKSIPVRNDPDKLAKAAIALLVDDAAWAQQSLEQVEYAERYFSKSALRATLLPALTGSREDRWWPVDEKG
jgi:glycosyltransferase involved in cell wall biosynthesis